HREGGGIHREGGRGGRRAAGVGGRIIRDVHGEDRVWGAGDRKGGNREVRVPHPVQRGHADHGAAAVGIPVIKVHGAGRDPLATRDVGREGGRLAISGRR